MPMSCLNTDLDTIFSSLEFGEEVGAIRNGDIEHPISGIFDDEDVESRPGDGTAIIIPQAMFTCRLSDVPDLTNGDRFIIRNTTYILKFWKNSGDGTVELYFEKDN